MAEHRPESPAGLLRALHERGGTAAAHPELPRLLARAGADDLAAAGRLLAGLDPDEVLRHHPGTPTVRIAVTGRGTVTEVVPALAAELARHGLLPRFHLSGSGTYVGDLADPHSALYAHRPEVTLCLLDPWTVWDAVPVPWQPLDVSVAAERQLRLLSQLAEAHAAHAPAGAVLVLNTVPLLRRHTHQLTSHAHRAELGGLWRQFTADLLFLARPSAGLAVLDLEPVTSAGARADDPRLGAYADAHCAGPLLAGYAREAAHLVRGLRGAAKKCLVLDLDGTLWDGVLAEDGPRGVSAAGSLRGAAFGAFQRTVKQLASQGVLLAVCSKNDPGPVARALACHPEFPLGAGDFQTVVADWGSKAEGVRTIAARLGIAPESVVFADDLRFEQESVAAGVPGAAVVPLDGEPALHPERLLADGWFDTPDLTDEDRRRPARYAERAARDRLRTKAVDHHAFLAGLGLRVEVAPAQDHETARISQLSLRTNRFNLTGARLSTEEVRRYAAEPGGLVLAVRVADRFGDDGVAGAALARTGEGALHLDALLLSCRVLGRGVEEAVLGGLLRAARGTGHTAVHTCWRPTRANAALRGLLETHGFRPRTAPEAGGGATGYTHPLGHIGDLPGHVELRLRLPHRDGETEVSACAPSRN
ncbi:HAD-IIIC family phosphatase [Streptomyces albus]|uniref:HAD-IIIC family phosphatase n=1 Tax=Streptomyces sp. PHES57 TaxID=2872626 RepID=UPI001CEC4262|nr:HAD-IIIC family phosphatase [Streptomyces sp. PHES57]